MLMNTPCFCENDILINDRGFLSREMTNYLKTVRKVDIYLPAKENMTIYVDAVKLVTTNENGRNTPIGKGRNRKSNW